MSQPSAVSASPTQLSWLLILVLGAIAALTPLAIDMYLPAMPAIAADLNAPSSAVKSTLVAYTAGFAIGQLFHGPISDSYGRKPVMLAGVALFFICAVISAMAQDIDVLTFVRATQGFAGAAAAVIIQALVRDMFEREEFARTMSFITLVMTIAPLAAPMIGGYLLIWFDWRAIFWVLAAWACFVTLCIIFRIPETLPRENRPPMRIGASLRNYARMLKTPFAVGMIFCSGFSFAGMFSFLTAGSFVYIDYYGVSAQMFGYLFALNIVCLIVMTFINGRLVRKMGSHWMLRLGLGLQLAAGIAIAVFQWLDVGLWGTVVPVMMYVGVISTIGSNSMACLLACYPQMAGTASSLAGTMRFGIGSLVGAGVAVASDGTPWGMVGAIALCAILSAAFYWLLASKES
ncbi:Bcr/CflA family multidrug efflux MFS transporter [Salinivibrio sp. ES.052]|uniref:Bcr/CflA family multidrug efflux MFS transporter n=1 Tax=Salinivibrio sp. ES.052 TaxID=1882823 RepID=UPI0009264CD2|nr:Bcr/CflA family multidrug efflux MFS transporter [Salinivibrio sp. ES.052]SIN84898.1 MFS transporter, DHA1 family, bicyclomycin/chloramphenicol resistance protein [Salinivibrio sp. ES.052]